MNFFGSIVTFFETLAGEICNPNATTQAECDAAITFVQAALVAGAVITGFPALADINAPAIFKVVTDGACVATTDLANALSYLDALNASATTKGLKIPVAYPAMSTTRAWLATDMK